MSGPHAYFRFNPENSGTLNSHSLNGGGGDVAFRALRDPAGAGRLRADPVRQWIHAGKSEPEQLPLSGGHSIPVLTTKRL